MGMFNDRMYLPRRGEPSGRQQIPQQPGRPQAMGMPQMGMPQMGSQGLFNAYMSQLFNQKYAPPMMQGSPLQSFGGFMGFGSPQMSRMQAPQQPGLMNSAAASDPRSPLNSPGITWSEYMGAGS